MQDPARSRGATVVGMPVPVGSPGDRLLESLGYEVRWTSWVLQLPEGATIVERPLPEGYAVRAADPSEYPAVARRRRGRLPRVVGPRAGDLRGLPAVVMGRPGFEPWMLRVVTDPAGEVVGVATVSSRPRGRPPAAEAFISRLAVRRDQRNRGLAQALMVDAFARRPASTAR